MNGRLAGQLRASQTRAYWRDNFLRAIGYSVAFANFFYLLMGIPTLQRAETVASDQVSPYHRMICLALFGVALPVLMLRWRDAWRLTKACWPLMLISAWFVASIFWALDEAASLRRVTLHLVSIGTLMAPLLALRDVRKVHLVLAAIGVVLALSNLGALILAPSASMSDIGFTGLLPQKNVTGMALMISLLSCSAAIFLVPMGKARFLFCLSAAVALALLVLTRSSTSITVAALGLLTMPAAVVLSELEPRMVRSTLIIGGVLLLLAPLGYGVACAIIDVDPFAPLKGVTFTQRTDIWAFEWAEIVKRPWTGYGFGSFWAIDPSVQLNYKVDGWFANPDLGINEGHNGYLDILATVGIVGAVLTAMVYIRALFVAWWLVEHVGQLKRRRLVQLDALMVPVFMLAILLGTLVHNFTESTLFANNGSLGQIFIYVVLQLEWTRMSVLRREGRN